MRDKHEDDFSREVYGVFGIPVDVATVEAVVERVRAAAGEKRRFLLSTPNLNFLISSRSAELLRHSLLMRDLCPPDGMPVVWLARLLGAPVKSRVSGSHIFLELKPPRHKPHLRVF